jgi:hypothetical protein
MRIIDYFFKIRGNKYKNQRWKKTIIFPFNIPLKPVMLLAFLRSLLGKVWPVDQRHQHHRDFVKDPESQVPSL